MFNYNYRKVNWAELRFQYLVRGMAAIHMSTWLPVCIFPFVVCTLLVCCCCDNNYYPDECLASHMESQRPTIYWKCI